MESDEKRRSRYSDNNDFQPDANNIIIEWADGFYGERKSKIYTPWASRISVEALKPGCDTRSPVEKRRRGFCSAVLVHFDEMENAKKAVEDFRWLPDHMKESTREAICVLYDPVTRQLKREFKGKGIWGADDDNNSWLLVIERFDVNPDCRRQGWGRKLVTRVLKEVLAKARLARKTVLVLSLPAPSKNEIQARTMDGKQSLRIARAFWRSVGFVRLGETLFYGWARTSKAQLLEKATVTKSILDEDLEIDRRCGHLAEFERTWNYWQLVDPQHKQDSLAAF